MFLFISIGLASQSCENGRLPSSATNVKPLNNQLSYQRNFCRWTPISNINSFKGEDLNYYLTMKSSRVLGGVSVYLSPR